MDHLQIKQAFFTDSVHNSILFSAPLGVTLLANIMTRYGINDFYEDDLPEKDARILGSGLCPVFFLASSLVMDKNFSAVDAVLYLLQNEIEEDIAYQAGLYFVPPGLIDDIIDTFIKTLTKDRNALTAIRGENQSLFTDMRKHEVLTYAYYTPSPLPKGTFRLL